jgi:hypothetical protein
MRIRISITEQNSTQILYLKGQVNISLQWKRNVVELRPEYPALCKNGNIHKFFFLQEPQELTTENKTKIFF